MVLKNLIWKTFFVFAITIQVPHGKQTLLAIITLCTPWLRSMKIVETNCHHTMATVARNKEQSILLLLGEVLPELKWFYKNEKQTCIYGNIPKAWMIATKK